MITESTEAAARAAYDARILTVHEIGSWPAYRDGYEAGLAAARADAARLLLAAAKEALEFIRGEWRGDNPYALMAVVRDAIAACEAGQSSPPAQA